MKVLFKLILIGCMKFITGFSHSDITVNQIATDQSTSNKIEITTK